VIEPVKTGEVETGDRCHGLRKVRIQCPAKKDVSCHENMADCMKLALSGTDIFGIMPGSDRKAQRSMQKSGKKRE
jgi:hypothetical protein